MKKTKDLINDIVSFVKLHNKLFIIIISIICIILGIIINNCNTNVKEAEYNEYSKEEDKFNVKITGALNKEINYQTSGEYLFEVINKCGGLSDYADISKINLLTFIDDNFELEIPYTDVYHDNQIHIKSYTNSNEFIYLYFGYYNGLVTIFKFNKDVSTKEIMWLLNLNEGDYGIYDNNILSTDYSYIQNEVKVSINKASASELSLISGITSTIAKRIIEYREKYGTFKSLDELLNVNGITNTLLNKIRDVLTLN